MRSGIFTFCGLSCLLLFASQGLAKSKAKKAMPTASIPIEPFSEDEEIFPETAALNEPEESEASAEPVVATATRSGSHDVAAAIRVQMTQEGFGGQLRLLEFSRPWLAVSQTLRYFAPDGEGELYIRRYGLMLGLELHPWRKARLSPFVTLQAGAERFQREPLAEDRDLFTADAAAGLELQLNRLASFSIQWLGSYYGDVRERLFKDQARPGSTHARLEVFFNMDWETTL